MVTREETTKSVLNGYRLGTVLIWIGVSVWVPFIILRAMGYTPSLFWFLPFHLMGVVGGSKVRAVARQEMDLPPTPKTKLRTVGHILVFIGILVWAPYFYGKLFLQAPLDVGQFLPYHLVFVLSGVFLLLVNFLMARRKS